MKGLIFTYVLAYGGAVVSVVNPFYGFLIYVCFAILRPETLWFWSVPAGNYSRIIAIAMLIGWAMKGFGDWRFGRAGLIVYALLGFWVWGLISTLVAADHQAAAIDRLEIWAKIFLPFLVGITTIVSFRQVKQLAWVILLSQGYLAFEMNLSYLSGWNRMHQGLGSLDNNIMSISFVTTVGMAFFLGLGADKWWQKAIAFGAAMLMIHAILFSFSRGGMLALCVTGGISFWLLPKRPWHYLAFGVVILVTLSLAGKEVTERFYMVFADGETRDESADSRLVLWGQCWELMQTHPLFGVGPAQWGYWAKYYFGWGVPKMAHSLWMQTGAEGGFIGLGLLVTFYLSCVTRLWGYARHSITTTIGEVPAYAQMVIAGLAGFAVAASFVSVDRLETPYYVVLIGAGCLKLFSVSPDETESDHEAFSTENLDCE